VNDGLCGSQLCFTELASAAVILSITTRGDDDLANAESWQQLYEK